MHYKRKEAFRYQFLAPIKGRFSILLNNQDQEKLERTIAGELEVIDLSPKGMRFATKLNLPMNKKAFLIEVTFLLEQQEITMLGKITWKKQERDFFYYGLLGFEDDEREQLIIQSVKDIIKHNRKDDGLMT